MTVPYEIGDRIWYRTGSGSRQVRVEQKESNIKNGRSGFAGTVLSPIREQGSTVWGYDEQIDWKEPNR